MIVSLDEQLEWQESSKTHSPKTPSAPEVLESLRKNSPPPTPSRGNFLLQSASPIKELSKMSGMEALIRFSERNLLKSARIKGDSLFFPDGSVVPTTLTLPLKVRAVTRADDGAAKVSIAITREDVDIGSVWISLVAEYTYETQLASLLRSRKGFVEISLEDRRIINRYFSGDLSLNALQNSGVWNSIPGAISTCDSLNELSGDGGDIISSRLRRRAQLDSLEGRKIILQEQQNRLRRLLARELQRQHSAKVSITAVPSTSTANSLSSPQTNQASPQVTNVVSKALNASKVKATSEAFTAVQSEQASDISEGNITYPKTKASAANRDNENLRIKLKRVRIEMFRVCSRLCESIEDQSAIERRVKRLRYEVEKVDFSVAGERIEYPETVNSVA